MEIFCHFLLTVTLEITFTNYTNRSALSESKNCNLYCKQFFVFAEKNISRSNGMFQLAINRTENNLLSIFIIEYGYYKTGLRAVLYVGTTDNIDRYIYKLQQQIDR